MKRLIFASFLVILCSCTAINSNRIAPGYVEAFSTLQNAFFGYQERIDPEVISNIPYASMLVRIGRGPESLMILESIQKDQYTWVSADGVYFVTKEGRIIKSSGLSNNLFHKESVLLKWEDIIYGKQIYTSYFSFSNPTLQNLKVNTTYQYFDFYKETLVFGDKDLSLIKENLFSDAIGWDEENKYWIDKNGFVWKSVQHISPKLPPIYIEVTKKPQ